MTDGTTIRKAGNGYVVTATGSAWRAPSEYVFTTFADAVHFLASHFGEWEFKERLAKEEAK